MKITVASKNPVKVNAVREAFKIIFQKSQDIDGVAVESGVSDQPRSDGETKAGAKLRVEKLLKQKLDADFVVGIEGGVDVLDDRLFAFAWVAISDGTKLAMARTGSFELPPQLAHLIFTGMELGDADDLVFNTKNSKQKNGAVGLLTNDVLNRKELYQQAIILALIPFINKERYP